MTRADRVADDVYDLIVLGGGSGGYAAALRAAQLGMSVALVEQDRLGGTCLHRGCIPTKALLHSAEVADVVRGATQHGITATYDGIDMRAVNKQRDKVVTRLYKGLSGLVASRGIHLIEGRGRFLESGAIGIEGRVLRGRNTVIATGSQPRSLPGLMTDGVRVLTSEDALRLVRVPKSVVVLGGGVIGCEFASIWRSFGANVTIVEALPRLLPAEDPAVSGELERAFRKRKIGLRLDTRFAAVESSDDGVCVDLSTGEGGQTLGADILLVAVGRGPMTTDLGLEELGVELDRGFVVTNERLGTCIPGVYAVGDVVAGLQLAHRSFQHGMFVAEEIAGLGPTVIEDSSIPRVTYSEPEVASVGLSEDRAREAFGDVAVIRHDLAGNGKSQILGTQGFVKLVRAQDRVVGVHMVGSRVSELVGEVQLLVNLGVDISAVEGLLHAHPTQGEAVGEALLALAGKPLHSHA